MRYTEDQITKGQELYLDLVHKAWESASFKEELIKNPKACIENLTGKKFGGPEGVRIVVDDQSDASCIYLNIPQKGEIEDMELSEDSLDAVSGGGDGTLDDNGWNIFKWLGSYARLRYEGVIPQTPGMPF